MASQNVRSSFYFWVFFFIMCYHANILEHLPNSIFEFCSNFAVYTIIRYLFLDLCFYKKKTVHIDELQDCCETGLIVFGSGASDMRHFLCYNMFLFFSLS